MGQHELPRRATGVELRLQTWRGRRLYAVSDPQARQYFHLGEREGWILERLGGASLEDLRAGFREAFGEEIRTEWLERVLEELGRCGLLEQEGGEKETPRRAFSILRLRLWGFRPQPFLDRLLPWVRFAFSRGAFAGGAAILAAGLIAGFSSLPALEEDWRRLFEPGRLPLLYVAVSGVVTLHELAHGLACRRFGARVREMGFYLLYFQPCVATDVTDSWLLDRRSSRIWIVLAPSVLQLWLVGAALLAWRLLSPGTARLAALAVVAVSALGILWNLNPLLPLDGYYALMDLVEIPNLRRRSFKLLASLVGLGSSPGQLRSAAEARIALLYATVAGIYSAGLIVLTVWFVLRWVYTGLSAFV
jgi:putative peptide zinc metalloprotease protein